jgi:hypothetical protein
MKTTSTFLVSALLASLILTACGEKPAEPEVTTEAPAAEAAPAPAAEPTPAPATPEAGGYAPTDDEKVPGVTMTQEELDAMFAEARANTPVAAVPGEEAPAAAPAVEAAPEEVK